MGKSLIAFDIDHIKEYVFATDKLKEIRGASSLLDYFNRIVMGELAQFLEGSIIYANGGSGLFLIDQDKAEQFGKNVERVFRDLTRGTASITYAVQELPEDAPSDIAAVLRYPLAETLARMRYLLHEAKNCPPEVIALPSHPFLHLCDSCGVEYADADTRDIAAVRDPNEENALFCTGCIAKRKRDVQVKSFITRIEEGQRTPYDEYLWDNLISSLRTQNYYLSPMTERPHDFNIFRNFKGAKDYLGLIYADANGIGRKIEGIDTLEELSDFARNVDQAIYGSVCAAITKHLKIGDHLRPKGKLIDDLKNPVLPFDILLLGGDDVVMVTPASVVLDVALDIAREFYRLTHQKHTLSVGVLFAPVNYPFGLQLKLVNDILRFAKQEGPKTRMANWAEYSDTRINFMIVTGSNTQRFKRVYESLYDKKGVEFYATLRPYEPEQLDLLLQAIREGHRLGLGRAKLHQLREAVLKKNLTTSVVQALSVLRNWRERQRTYIVQHVYAFGGLYQMKHSDPQNPASIFPRVTFPWFADGEKYRTTLLDFVELYDFISREEDDNGDES